MKDTVYQVRRALQSKGFLMAICLMLYSLFFIHTDAPTFFTMPLTYFRKDCTFYYHFIVSFWMGLSQYIIPIAAMLPLCFFLCEDQESRYHNLAAYRLPQGRYLLHRTIAAVLSAMMAVFLACVLFTGFLLLVCTTKGGGQEAWLLNRHDSAFAWLATTDHFLWFILAQYARLMLSAAIWAVAAVMFSLLWANKAFVFVATYGSSILLDVALGRYLGSEYSLSTLQTPDLNTATPLFTLFARQMMIFFVILALYLLVLFFSSSTKVAKINQKGQQFLARHLKPQILVTEWNLSRQICGTWRGRLLTDTRIFLTKATLIPAIIIPALVMFSKRVIQTPVHSIGDLWLDVFGGFYWFEPQINFTPIGLWILLLLPPMMGVALTLEQELRSRVQTTMHRFQTKMHWWASKCCAILIYTFTCTIVMFLSVATIGWLTGATGFGVLMEDADGF